MDNIKHTDAFDLAYRFATQTNLNIFLTGKAGTGKTTFLRYLRQSNCKNMVVAAPTGVAAINAGGVTLHSLFQLPFAPFVPSKNSNNEQAVNAHSLVSQIHYNKDKLDLLRKLELLIIDEASMVACHTVDAIDTLLRSVRRRYNEPFGGIQVLFIGDLHQLPPVVKRDEWEFLKNYYSSVFFFDSMVLKEYVPVMIELKEIFRQQDNTFIEILNGVRNDNLTPENLTVLSSRLRRNFVAEDKQGYITLTTHNYQADAINKEKLNALQGNRHTYRAIVDGTFPEHSYPADEELELKKGAQVMFLKNDTEERKYFNGKIGTVTALENDSIRVKCKGENEEIKVKKHEWRNINYTLNPETRQVVEEESGSFHQYPLRLAWAITIHKSQGLTFDKLIIDAENAFANGQVYVALSRCTSLEGLVLTTPVNQRFMGAHQNLKAWTEKTRDEKNLEQTFAKAKQTFIQKELQGTFTWKNWDYEMRNLNEAMQKNRESISSECFTWLENLAKEQKVIDDVATKFRDYMAGMFNQGREVEADTALQKRIKDAANYFSAEISKWKTTLLQHPLNIKTKKISRQVDIPLEEINTAIHEILRKIAICKDGFLLNTYIENNKKAGVAIEKIQSSYSGNRFINSGKNSAHMSLYNRLNELRKKLARENHITVSRIYRDTVIAKICENLPCDIESLMNIRGINPVKIRPYSNDIIQQVSAYCKENSIEPQKVAKSEYSVQGISGTVEETIKFFKSGKTITEIAKERNFVEGTIESHLAKAIDMGLINIEEIIPMAEVNNIAGYFTDTDGNLQLAGIKERVPEDISYGKLRMVLAWLQKKR